MTVLIDGNDWASRAAALAEELLAADKLSSPEWHKAVLEVPRQVFVPSYYVHRDGGMLTAGATDGQGRAQWLEMVYSNTALITKIAPNTGGSHTVRNTGHTRLWSHLEDAHHLWDAAGRPGWPRLGLAVTPPPKPCTPTNPTTPSPL